MGNHNLPELLAPAGGLTQLCAAVNNGADAVYLGGARFNARGKAENFTLPKLRDAIAYAHERNVKIYVTFNTLLKDRELPDALDYAGALWDIGADAVIVQDMGLVRMLRKYVPGLPLHLSTQGTVSGRRAVDLMKEFGICRIVPARELSLEEISEMARTCHDRTDRPYCELEVFVHGALCMCYSGQCQMSRILGSGSAGGKQSVRSGNRGLCAQPCRLPYTDDRGRTGYFLSPKDLCLLEDIPALAAAGVDSLKIEGRLKSAEYVAVVTGIYRRYLDEYAQMGTVRVREEDRRDLTQIYNRGGFTKGYLYGNPGDKILSGASPKNAGICIGTVQSVVEPKNAGKDRAAAAGAAKKGASLVDVKLTEPLAEGDGVEFRPAGGKTATGFKASGQKRTGADFVDLGQNRMDAAGGVVTFRKELSGRALRIGDMKGQIRSGDEVFRVTERALLERARVSFDTDDPADLDRRMIRRIPLQMRFAAAAGEPAVLVLWEKRPEGEVVPESGETDAAMVIRVVSEAPMEPARTRPSEPSRIRQQLEKLGGTPFIAAPEDIRVSIDGVCIVPAGEINRMRREGIARLLQEKRRVRRKPVDMNALSEAGRKLSERQLQVPELSGVPELSELPEMPELSEASEMPRLRTVALMEFMERTSCGGAAGEGVLPYIDAVSKGRLDEYIEENFGEIAARLRSLDMGILIRGNSWIRQFLDAGVRVYGGHGLNVFNEEARLAYEELGVQVLELSHETGHAGLAEDGRIPLMITEHPLRSKTLTDRKGQVHQIGKSAAGDKTIIW